MLAIKFPCEIKEYRATNTAVCTLCGASWSLEEIRTCPYRVIEHQQPDKPWLGALITVSVVFGLLIAFYNFARWIF